MSDDTLSNKQMDEAVERAEAHTQAVIAARIRNQPDMSNTRTEVDLFDAMAAKVRAGQPIHVSPPLTDPLLRLHMGTINRLRAETGLPVHVIYN